MTIDEAVKYFTTGWFAMDRNGSWWWNEKEPYIRPEYDVWVGSPLTLDLFMFEIPPVKDWKQSLVKIENGKIVNE